MTVKAKLGGALGAGLMLIAGPVGATDLVVGDGSSTLQGLHLYETVTVHGRLRVAPFDIDDPESGWLHLRAERIVVAASGVIDADGAGFQGTDPPDDVVNGPGEGVSLSAMGNTPVPGAGGSHVGRGGRGRTLGCSAFANSFGGEVYDVDVDPVALISTPQAGMGSAGGRSFVGSLNPNASWRGAHGGGVVILEAAEILIEGTVRANGETLGTQILQAGPGGGAGGMVLIQTPALSLGTTARIQARGSAGAAYDPATSNGGPGGGGIAWLIVQADVDTTGVIDVSGASYPACPNRAPAEAGRVGGELFVGCSDLDGDGQASALCGGDDCNDGRADIYDGAAEICDGVDNDCDGADDAGATCPTGSGQVCIDGACTADPNAPDDDDGGPVGEPPRLELTGGLCAARDAAVTETGGGGCLALGLALAAWLRRRRS